MHPNHYKNSLKRRTYTIVIALIVILLLSNGFLIFLLLSEKENNRKMLARLEESNVYLDNIYRSLNEKDYQKVYKQLAEARRLHTAPSPPAATEPPPQTRESTAPPQPISESAKADQMPPAAEKGAPEADENPQPLLFAEQKEYMLIVEKEARIVHVYRVSKNEITPYKTYPCIVGANSSDKQRDGDYATPLGVYFVLRYVPGSTLPENYGHGAYVLNYPNFLDRKANKKGSGIWLHGHSPGKTIQTEIPDTRGCVVVSNDALKEMGGFLKTQGVPIAIVNKLNFAKKENQNKLAGEIREFLDSWRKAWESRDVKKYLSFYSSEFVNNEGMGYQAFRQHKEKVNLGKKFIKVKIEDLSLLTPPEYGGKIVLARFLQRYDSNNFKGDSRKIFYLEKGQKGWQIIGESLY